ncbi:MAG: NfeD family protein [Alphaproteobacteria bacterium]|nr:NfeD family protein [Alphaproteobacteria bacterium]
MTFMDGYSLNYWTWFIAALVLLGLEMTIPGVIFIWMAIAGVIIGGIMLALPDLSWEIQFILFAIFSIISVFTGRSFLNRNPTESDDITLNQRGLKYVGQTFNLIRDMENGKGRVRVGDGHWNVMGDFDAPKGDKVRVTGAEATILIVEKVTK